MVSRQSEWQKANPEKRRAHQQVNADIKAGKLIVQPCSRCGSTDNVQAHHNDYSKPRDIDWLCFEHHLELHRKSIHKMPPTRLNLAIAPELYERLAKAAGEGGMNITAWIVAAINTKLHERRQYITLDPQGQLATGLDWEALMDEGQREMEQALARDKAREEEAQREFEAAMKGSEWEGI